MDFQPKRRAGIVTYGRHARKTIVHDFFADEKKKEPPKHKLPLSPNSPGTRSATEHIPDHDPPSPGPARPAHVTTHSASPVSLDIHVKSSSPSNSSMASTANDRLYDMISSDDETGPAVKRRKFQPSQRPETSRLNALKKPQRSASGPAVKARDQLRDPSNGDHSRRKSASPPHIRTHSAPRRRDLLAKPDGQSGAEDASALNMSKGFGQSHAGKSAEKDPVSPPRKKWQGLAGSQPQVESPSRLGLSRLRLTSNRQSSSSAESTDEQSVDETSYRPRGRRRLIDKLDAPEISDTEGQSEQQESSNINSAPIADTATLAGSQPNTSQPLKRSVGNNSSKPQTYGKSRTTYAKERSYLTDMVDDTDSVASSQDPSQQLTSELNAAIAQSQRSQLHHDLDMDDSSDDNQLTGLKLKSIHELRQAGTNQKLNRELESLFEDVDPSSPNATKSLRLQALMKLARKLTDSAFTVTVLNGGLRRLSQWLEKCPDLATNVLVALVAWKLCHAIQVSQSSLRLMHVIAVQVSKILLKFPQALPELIKDRKQNLSKAITRDLLDFERDAIQDELLPAQEGQHIIPAVIALGLLNDTIRMVVEYKLDNSRLAADLHQQIYEIVVHPSLAEETDLGERFMVRLALTFWQTCCGPLDDDLQLRKEQYHDLGNAMSRFLVFEDSSLVFATLHLAATLANNRSHICRTLASTSLPALSISFVRETFMRLTNDAKSGTEIDTTLLNELVLALAFLIKLTEHDDANRISISQQMPDGNDSAIELLTITYLTVGPQVKDATTAEQSQVLVALGYLSILLCALSLEPTVRRKIRLALGNTSLEEVRGTGVEFLKMFLVHATQTAADEGLGDDADATVQIDDSTKGFAQILDACRI